MGDFQLPSGLIVQTKEPTYGEEVDVIDVGLQKGPGEYTFAKTDAIVTSLSREQVRALSREDGHALMEEVNRIFSGRQEKEEIPFEKPSRRRSPGGNHLTPTHSPN